MGPAHFLQQLPKPLALAPSSAAQRLNDHHLVGRAQRPRQIAHLLAIDEDADVAPYPVLLVDHAKTNPGVSTVQVGEDGGKRSAARLGLAALGVRAQRAGYEHLHCVIGSMVRPLPPPRSPPGAPPS